LKQNIREEIAAIPLEVKQRVMGNLHSRVYKYTERDGSYVSDVIFKI
jgi:hypothetical protein